MAATKTRPSALRRLQDLIDHPRTKPEEREAAERMLMRLKAKHAAASGESGARQGSGWVDPRFYGKRYDRSLTTTQIAAIVRQDIKMARKMAAETSEDDGPGAVKVPNPIGDAPQGIKFSIRTEYFSGGSAINIVLRGMPTAWAWTTEQRYGHDQTVPTPALKALATELRELANAFNHDGSDITTDYFDVNFYLSLSAESPHGYALSI